MNFGLGRIVGAAVGAPFCPEPERILFGGMAADPISNLIMSVFNPVSAVVHIREMVQHGELTAVSVDTSEKVYIMYHGTKAQNVASILDGGFRVSENGMLGRGVYVSTDINKTLNYGDVTLKLLVWVGETRLITSQNQPDRKIWQSEADSAWVPANCGMVPSGRTETCLKHPRQACVIGISRGFDLLDHQTRIRTRDRSWDRDPAALDQHDAMDMAMLKSRNGDHS